MYNLTQKFIFPKKNYHFKFYKKKRNLCEEIVSTI